MARALIRTTLRLRGRVLVPAALTLVCAPLTLSDRATANFVGAGVHPWLIVLCTFTDQGNPPSAYHTDGKYTPTYYQQLFSDAGAGSLGLFDYWHDVSFGQLSVSGTQVRCF
jgi:hypothetical protein